MSESFLDGKVVLYRGDCREQIRLLEECSIDSVVTDPPYSLASIVKRFGKEGCAAAKSEGPTGVYRRASSGFMGKQWDTGEVAFDPNFWAEVWRVLKPGAHLVAMGGTRTYHHLAMAIEQAGFEIRDQIGWCYGSGFPKSHDVSKGIDRIAGAEREKIITGKPVKRIIPGADQNKAGWEKNSGREYVPGVEIPVTESAIQWQGWGTALKPAWEPICLARKPLSESSIAANVLKHGTGGINVDGCRIATADGYADNAVTQGINNRQTSYEPRRERRTFEPASQGRWPANLIHDGSEEVLAGFPETQTVGHYPKNTGGIGTDSGIYHGAKGRPQDERWTVDSGSAARFFYTAKADADDRLGSKHPTVKPLDLMQYLVRLITPKGGVVMDPFAGTGTTGEAAWREGMRSLLIEREEEYQADIVKRMGLCLSGPDERRRETIKAAGLVADAGPLFGGGQRDGEPRRRNVAAGFAGEERKKDLRRLRGREGDA